MLTYNIWLTLQIMDYCSVCFIHNKGLYSLAFNTVYLKPESIGWMKNDFDNGRRGDFIG